jgi:hypothetical protein
MFQEDEIYEVAKQRIDQRNRRRMLWALDLGGLTLSLALVALVESPITAALFLAWGGIFTVHTILMVMANTKSRDIEREVARLRAASAATASYEKPKRLELGDDGELIEIDDLAELSDKARRDSL